jgi:hypothetical protein
VQVAGLQIEGTPDQQETIRQALDSIAWPVDSAGLTIVVTSPGNLPPNAAATYLYPGNVISLNSDVVNDPARQPLAKVLAHEIGHMFDCGYLDQDGRDEYLSLRGFPAGTDWRSEDSDWALRPSEDFAEVFAAFATPASRIPIATDIGRTSNPERIGALIARYQPSPEQRTPAPARIALTFAR